MNAMKKGVFIALEGCEGVGKSTQLKRLEEFLRSTGREVVVTREPGGTPLAEGIRDLILHREMDALTECYLFASARIDHINKVILPAVERGAIVLCDRYIDSSFAYQAYARGLGIEKVRAVNAYAVENCMPDLTVFIDMNPLESFRVKSGKKIIDDRMENEGAEFHLAVYNGFKQVAADEPERFVSVKPCEEKDETAAKIREAVIKSGVLS